MSDVRKKKKIIIKRTMDNSRTKILQHAWTSKQLCRSRKILINIKKEQSLVQNSKKSTKKNLLKIHLKKLQENILQYTHSRYTTPCCSETSKNNFEFMDFFFPHFHNKLKMGTIDNFIFCWGFLYITSVFSFLRKLNIPPSKNIVKKFMKNRIIKRQTTI